MVDLGRNPKILKFTKFSREDKVSTIEHIARFTVQCGNLGGIKAAKLRLFPNSLTGAAFTWYFNLPANSVQSWQKMEELFHTQFYRTEPEVTIADLAKMTQESGETIEGFITRFKTVKYKCPTPLPKAEYAKMALGGLSFEFRKWFTGQYFLDLGQLVLQAVPYEQLLKEEGQHQAASIRIYYKDFAGQAFPLLGTGNQKQVDYVEFEIDAAEILEGKPYVCKALARPSEQAKQAESKAAPQRIYDSKVNYSFDISKAEVIFDQLLKDKQMKLPPGHQIPPSHELKDQKYYKWHNTRTHTTTNCVVLRNALQKAITIGCLQFPIKEKGSWWWTKTHFQST
ncbi:uncharacterized protein LOC122672401 [Telopea speciosissima]|uniref:uncharacterized protein LOC122672401 n=1 Tax=Telopea speciosissima TaxID=54955 RepID=UPI001CC67108|nr:uncharacterized protein LOC122672401 [Telopea speciosissima]